MNLSRMSDIELMSLHKAIHERIKKLEHDIRWLERMSERHTDYVTKLAIAQTESSTLITLRSKTSEELTLRDYKSKSV